MGKYRKALFSGGYDAASTSKPNAHHGGSGGHGEKAGEEKAIEGKKLQLANVPAKSKLAAAGHEKSPRF
jgi:hypothetical protein